MIRSAKGTHDILPEEWPRWQAVEDAAERVAVAAGYERIEIPMFEETELFTHATGEHTDVNREMYTFDDRGGGSLALRPEGTASVFRAYFEHGLRVRPQPVKLYYLGSMFRYESPQSGRTREHHQFGCEAIGSGDPLLDASLIDLQRTFYDQAGLPPLSIHINSIGDEACRPGYLTELVAYLKAHEHELCGQCRERITRNPLRVLDCKVETCQSVLDDAPKTLERLCEPCREHWGAVLKGLAALDVAYQIDTRLVRGLDYYTRTVWEFLPPVVTAATSTIGAGGRYDALAAAIGGPSTPGVGFSTGIERVLLNMPAPASEETCRSRVDVFGAHLGEEAELRLMTLARSLRLRGLTVDLAFGKRSLGAQLKQADGRGARLAAIMGEDEVANGTVTLRGLRTGNQESVPLDGAEDEILMRVDAERES